MLDLEIEVARIVVQYLTSKKRVKMRGRVKECAPGAKVKIEGWIDSPDRQTNKSECDKQKDTKYP